MTSWKGAAAALILIAGAEAATAQSGTPEITAQTLVDRAKIEDLLTRYYYNLGRGSGESFAAFYTADAELVLGGKSYKGLDGIADAYKGARADPNNPRGAAFAFNTTIGNPLIVVRGDTATAQLIFTEFLTDKAGSPPRVLVQGREYDDLVRVKGEWRIRRRQIAAGTTPPAGWTN